MAEQENPYNPEQEPDGQDQATNEQDPDVVDVGESRDQEDLESQEKYAREFLSDYVQSLYVDPTTKDENNFGAYEMFHILRDEDFGELSESERAKILIEVIVEIVTEKSLEVKTAEEKENLDSFVSRLKDGFFYSSPNVTSFLPLMDRLSIGAKLSKTAIADSRLKSEVVGELVYDFSGHLSYEATVNLSEGILSLGVKDQLESISTLKRISFDAIGQGEWAYSAIDVCNHVLRNIEQDSQLTIVKITCRDTIERINDHLNSTSDYYDGHYHSKPNMENLEDSKNFSTKVNPTNPEIQLNYHNASVASIASDAIAIYDRYNEPVFYALCDNDALVGPDPDVSIQDINTAKTIEQRSRQGERLNVQDYFDFYLNHIAKPILKAEDSNNIYDRIATFNAEKIGILTQEEFSDFANLNEKFLNIWIDLGNLRSEIIDKAADDNAKLSREIIDRLTDYFDTLSPEEELQYNISDLKNEIVEYSNKGSLEGAYVVFSKFVNICTITDPEGKNFPPQFQEIIDLKRSASESHIKNFEDAEIEFSRIYNEIQQSIPEAEMTRYGGYIDKINENLSEFITKIKDIATSQLDEHQDQYLNIEFTRFDKMSSDISINPIKPGEENLPELIQILAKPEMRKAIESELGVNLLEINFANQVSLLRFLSGSNQETFEKLKNVIEKNKDFSQEILSSFLASSEDPEYGNKIIEIAENLGPQSRPIFEKYSEITEACHSIDGFLAKEIGEGRISQEEKTEIVKKLLGKGRDILVFSYQKMDETAQILEKLDGYNVMLLSLASTLKTAREAGRPIEVYDLINIEFDELAGTEISEEDKMQMRKISRENWMEPPNPNSPEAETIRKSMRNLLPEITKGLEAGFSSEDCRFSILRSNKMIIGFIRFEHTPEGLYAGSFNIHPSARGSTFGEWMNRRITSERAKSEPIIAMASPMQDVTDLYISERGGFVVEDIDPNVSNTGEAGFKMVQDPSSKDPYSFAGKDRKEIVESSENPDQLPEGVVILHHDHLNPDQYQQFVNDCQNLLSQNKVMTRFFRYPNDSMVKYAVFEPKHETPKEH